MNAPRKLSMIVAVSENGVIGAKGDLPWHLSADLKRFKRLTMGHAIIMGRKTYESIGCLLPGRKTVILTRQPNFRIAGAQIVASVEQALSVTASDDSPFVIGGAQIYRLFLPHVTELQLTRVHATVAGDTRLPPIDWNEWERVASQKHTPDEKNNFEYSFEVYRRLDRR